MHLKSPLKMIEANNTEEDFTMGGNCMPNAMATAVTQQRLTH